MGEMALVKDAIREIAPLLTAILCGGLIGMEREARGKPAGIRTTMLICLGTTAFVQASELVVGSQGDPTRVMGQVITGIGFLGAGTIITLGGRVVGLTTAATIWVTAAVGVALGMGWYIRGLAWTLLCVLVLEGFRFLEARLTPEGHRGNGGSASGGNPPPFGGV